jgi:hypothetical protein
MKACEVIVEFGSCKLQTVTYVNKSVLSGEVGLLWICAMPDVPWQLPNEEALWQNVDKARLRQPLNSFLLFCLCFKSTNNTFIAPR